jgi:hypothetical protein
MHWLGPYVIIFVTKESAFQLEKLNGEIIEGLVDGSWLKMYRDSCASMHYHDNVVCVP